MSEYEKILKELKGYLKKEGYVIQSERFYEINDYINTNNYALNYILSKKLDGGIPAGRIIEICGDPLTGKTQLALTISCEAIKKGYIVYYVDCEKMVNQEFIYKIVPQDYKEIIKNLLIPTNVETIEDLIHSLNKLLNFCKERNFKNCLVVIDGIATLPTLKELTDIEADKNVLDMTKAKMLHKLTRMLSVFQEQIRNLTIIFTNHFIYDISKPYTHKITPGGQAIPYLSSIRLKLSATKLYSKDRNNVRGLKIKADTFLKNRIYPDAPEIEFELDFQKGVDKYSGLIDLFIKLGKVEKVGRKYIFNKKEYAFNKKEDLIKDILNSQGIEKEEKND